MAISRHRRSAGLLVALLVLVLAGVGAYAALDRWRGGQGADTALRRDVVPALPTVSSGPPGPISIADGPPASERVLRLVLEPPDGAEAVRFDQDPGFDRGRWQPVAATMEVPLPHSGYQTVFAQFRLADGSTTEIFVTGGVVDPDHDAATSSADGPHRPSFARPFSPTEVLVRVEAGRLERGGIEPYDLDSPAPDDEVKERNGRLVVERDGTVHGFQVSKRLDAIRRPDRLLGRPLDVDAVVGGEWSISASDDPNYGAGVQPVGIRYLARPSGSGVDHNLDPVREVTHDLILTMPRPLVPGATYRITGPELAEIGFRHDPDSELSPAVRVNQVGFAPGDRAKIAYLAGWFDGIGASATDLDQQPGFRVVDVDSGAVASRGTGRLRSAGDEMGRGDLTGTPVIELDFSTLTRTGRYQVCVDRIGCSHRFEIADTVWHRLTTTVGRAMYHQRSGIELGPPYTPIRRPRPYHPADGATVVASDYSLLRAQVETGNTDFSLLTEQQTEQPVDTAWGGHFDAGDWDRRINHLWYARNAAQLVDRFPETFAGREMQIPESGDDIPDLLDEALWTVDLFRRMQEPDGAIRGGIEASRHPPADTPSWADDLAIFAYRPDRFSSYLYAGVAAEVSSVLAGYDHARADELLASAVSAMRWAEAARSEALPDSDGAAVTAEVIEVAERRVAQQRNVAAAALLVATGDRDWHDLFVRTADFLDDVDPLLSCHRHTRCDAAWLYLQADESLTDPDIVAELRRRFVASADATIAAAEGTAYGWTTENPFVPLVWGLGSGGAPHTSGLLKAYLLTGEVKYRAAAVRSAGVALGANPMNRVLLTGLGTEPVRHPQIIDVKFGGLPVWAGTPVYGHHMLNALDDDGWVFDDNLGPGGAEPDPGTLPYLWQWYDVDSVALFNEFTVHQSHAEALLTFGTLAGTAS